MISNSTQWHLDRRKKIIAKYPAVTVIPRYNSFALIPMLIIPLLQFLLAYLTQYWSIGVVCVIAWMFGSLCNFAMFNYSHELSHDLIHPKIRGRFHEFLLHYASILCISPSIYILFRFGHKPHHAKLGESLVSTANKFLTEKYPDIGLLQDRYYYELTHVTNEKPRGLIPFVFNNKILRLFSVGIYFPIVSTIKGVFLVHFALLLTYFKSLFLKRNKEYHKRINAIFIQMIVFYCILVTLYSLSGPIVILYLLLSEASLRGLFFNPIIIFPMTSHKMWEQEHDYQPTTSTYNWLVSLILMKLNYHVEHHDFPDIPCRYLPHIKKIAPEFYVDLVSFTGIFDVLRQYYKSPHWYYAGAQSKVSHMKVD
jgi:sphingolipid delta-4 desaturase